MIDLLVERKIDELKRRGVKPNMRVAFLANTSAETMSTLLALWQIEAIACPLNPRLPLQALKNAIERLSPVFNLDTEENAHCFILQGPSALALLLFTSGTTSEPKIAAFSLKNLMKNALGANKALDLTSEDSWRLSLPLYHVSGIGIILRCLLAQATVSFDDSPCSYLSLVPTQLYRMMQENSEELLKAKGVIVGGAPLGRELLQKCLKANIPIYTTWGMTETSSMVTLGLADATGHSGRLLLNRELRIDEHGEIWVKGETLFMGYLERDCLRRPCDKEGWFATGDLGAFDTRGRLHWKGRKDNLFISLGENVQPEEIETLLLTAPGVRQAIVVPISDPESGAFPVAFIDQEKTIDAPSLQQFLKKHLASFKVPRHFFSLNASYGLKPSRHFLSLEAVKLLKFS